MSLRENNFHELTPFLAPFTKFVALEKRHPMVCQFLLQSYNYLKGLSFSPCLQVTKLAHLASSCGNHSIDYGQVDIIGIIVTVVSSHVTTANGSVISSNLLVNY